MASENFAVFVQNCQGTYALDATVLLPVIIVNTGNGPSTQNATLAQIANAGSYVTSANLPSFSYAPLATLSSYVTSATLANFSYAPLATLSSYVTIATLTSYSYAPLASVRTLLTQATTYYMSPSGSDGNNGTSVGAPWASFSHAFSIICNTIDFGGQTVTLQLANGTYTTGASLTSPWVGGGALVITGNSSSATYVQIATTTSICFSNTAVLPGTVTIQNLTVSSSSSAGICNYGAGTIKFNNIAFGAFNSGNMHLLCYGPGAVIVAGGNYSIKGAAGCHVDCQYNGVVLIAGVTVTIAAGSWNFASGFIFAQGPSLVVTSGTTWSGSANVTGQKYSVTFGSILLTGGTSGSLPGGTGGS